MSICTRCQTEDIVCLCRGCRRQMREGTESMTPERAAAIAEDVGAAYPPNVFSPVPLEGFKLVEGETIGQGDLDMIISRVAADMGRHTAALIAARIREDGEDNDD